MTKTTSKVFCNLKEVMRKLTSKKKYQHIKYSDIEYYTRLDLIPFQVIGKRKYYDFDVFFKCFREIEKLKRSRYACNKMKPVLNKRLWYKSFWNESEKVSI